ncbi:STAS domain-containing protein [Streptomyces bottropensis]|uniref:STAS domain-containing protein n=2 Tax=Streptomyces bottropensis TaxID=42235 RepID=UPI0036A3CC5B
MAAGADLSSVTRRIPGGNWVGPLSCRTGCRVGRRSASVERTPLPEARQGGSGFPASPHPLPDGLLNRGVMPLSQLTVCRHVRRNRALITLAGEIDLESASLVRTALARCLSDGIRTVDVDLTSVTFCDCSGLNAFLHAAQRTTEAGGILRLHHPPLTLGRILDLTGCGFLLLGVPFGHLSPPPGDVSAPAAQALPQRVAPLAAVLSGDAR